MKHSFSQFPCKIKKNQIIFRSRRWREFLDWFHSVDSDSFDPFVPGLATSDWLHQHTAMGKRHMTWVRTNIPILFLWQNSFVCVSREKKPGGGGGRKWHLHKKRCRKEEEEGMGERKGDVLLRERFLSIGGQLASEVHKTYTQFSHLKDTAEKCFKIVDKFNAKSAKSF